MPRTVRYVCVNEFKTDMHGRISSDPKRKEVTVKPGEEVPAHFVEKISPSVLHNGWVEMRVGG